MTDIHHYNLKEHNSFGISAECRRFIEYSSIGELQDIISEIANLNEPRVLHIGGGNNLLFTKDFDGIVLHSAIRGIEHLQTEGDEVLVRAGAGEDWDEFVGHCVEQGWYGLENLSLIPGEVGASAIQNIGAYGAEVCNNIKYVEAIDAQTGQKRIFEASECRYGYRSSIFKHELRGRYYVTAVVFSLSLAFRPDLEYKALSKAMAEKGITAQDITPHKLRQLIIDVRRSKLPDPHEVGNAGSFFINPVVERSVFENLSARYPQIPHFPQPDGRVKVPAGWLIEQCGWKGKTLGKAGVWKLQALVLVNTGGATGQDIVKLSEAIRSDVKKNFGIDIFPEVNFL